MSLVYRIREIYSDFYAKRCMGSLKASNRSCRSNGCWKWLLFLCSSPVTMNVTEIRPAEYMITFSRTVKKLRETVEARNENL
jgi:hypothetical protein